MRKPLLLALALLLIVSVMPASAGIAPSKTAPNQSIDSRDADIAMVRDAAASEQVAKVLADHGFTQAQVEQKLAQMSSQDLHQLAQNVDQLQAAGLTRQEWTWILIGAIAALLIIVLATN